MDLPSPLDTLSPEEQRIVRENLRPVTFTAGQCIFRAGDAGDGCYLIESGEVRLELVREHVDTDSVLGFIGLGSILGELALLDGLPRSVTAYAETPVVAAHLPAGAITAICDQRPVIGTGIVRALARDAAKKLRHMNERLGEYIVVDNSDDEIDETVKRGAIAQEQLAAWSEQQIDALLETVAKVVAANAEPLAAATVSETRLCNVADKTLKNLHASLGVFDFLVGKVGAGIVDVDASTQVTQIAGPAGIVFGLVPVTNPVATIIFKVLISIKARCALILSFNRSCMQVGNASCGLIAKTLVESGAPANIVQWVRSRSTRAKTLKYMRHPGVSLILATGGPGMVRAAYSSGKPALGAGPGNVPVYIAADADIEQAAASIVASKSYDNGLICGAEHNLVVHGSLYDRLSAALERHGAAVLNAEEVAKLETGAMRPGRDHIDPRLIGQSAAAIAVTIGFQRPYTIKLIVAPATPEHVEQASPLVAEKLAPIVSLLRARDDDEAFAISLKLLKHEGAGHTAIIHTASRSLAERFGIAMPAGRILINSPGAQGISGATTGLVPSFTLGCGTYGGNSTTDNVSYHSLLNIKRLAHVVARAPNVRTS
jgi:acyl-CoA reductase-like NAD-dependent aldehyde dehydrogenase